MGAFFAEYGLMLFWAAIAILAFAVEAATADIVSIWFIPGAVISMILSLWVEQFWIQLVVFFVFSIGMLLITGKHFKRKNTEQSTFNADSLIGAIATVQETVDNMRETGSVKIKGLVWTARSAEDGTAIPTGTLVEIKEISGVKLICVPKEGY